MLPDPIHAPPSPASSKNLSQLECRSISSADDPLFQLAYTHLWQEFGAANELESPETLSRRLKWNLSELTDGLALAYELVLLTANGSFAAACDHTVILDFNTTPPSVTVHLSHVLIDPAWRRTGLATQIRAIPVQKVHATLAAFNLPLDLPTLLIGEMEHPLPDNQPQRIRLISYEKAGFQKVDPRFVPYLQPDFRPPAVIDQSGKGAQCLPLSLVLYSIHEPQPIFILSSKLKKAIHAIYTMFGLEIRTQEMLPAFASLENYPPDAFPIPLIPPTSHIPPD